MSFSPDLVEFWAQPGDTIDPAVMDNVARALHDHMGVPLGSVLTGGSNANNTHISPVSDYDFLVPVQAESDNPFIRLAEWTSFRDEIRQGLEARFKAKVIDLSQKCVNIDSSLELPSTDIVACLSRTALINGTPVELLEFWTNERNPKRIISSPSAHQKNGKEKDSRTDGAFKQLVRVAKNGRGLLVANDLIGPATAPSYMIESSAMNMPDRLFTGDPLEDLRMYVAFMKRALGPSSGIRLRAGNGLHSLVGKNTLYQWNYEDAKIFTRELAASLPRQRR